MRVRESPVCLFYCHFRLRIRNYTDASKPAVEVVLLSIPVLDRIPPILKPFTGGAQYFRR